MTNKPQHTPGPWYVAETQFSEKEDYKHLTINYTDSNRDCLIADLFSSTKREAKNNFIPSKHTEKWANALLIAAAPEMLEALGVAVSIVQDFHHKLPNDKDRKRVMYLADQIGLAIKKAKGE